LWNCKIAASCKYEKSLFFTNRFPPADLSSAFNSLQHEADFVGNKIKASIKNYSLISGVYEYPGTLKIFITYIPAL